MPFSPKLSEKPERGSLLIHFFMLALNDSEAGELFALELIRRECGSR